MGVPGIALVDAVGVQGSALGVAAVATGVEEPTVAGVPGVPGGADLRPGVEEMQRPGVEDP